ncbi:MAG: thioredoxin [Nanoarchaeota archaeon]|nr:thioredoxin [Nanoarchaeota archaeon]MBU1269884.1 thioredoxin [Nanoarchaeota archaeon]MBU1603934.1 thioredoxin [Nanoarchaeota archaeon]MBU2442551.1 thioredoxin [Nanoarchaeota archaeon]
MLHLTQENFEKETKKGKVVVDFWAEWCGPCKMLGPIFESLSAEMKGVKFAKVNVDENEELSTKYGIRGIPTMILFKDGKEVSKLVGALPKESLKKKIEELFK